MYCDSVVFNLLSIVLAVIKIQLNFKIQGDPMRADLSFGKSGKHHNSVGVSKSHEKKALKNKERAEQHLEKIAEPHWMDIPA